MDDRLTILESIERGDISVEEGLILKVKVFN